MQHEQTQGVIEWMGNLGKHATHVFRGESLGERAAPAQIMTRFDRIAPQRLAFSRSVLKEVLQGIVDVFAALP